MPLSAMNVTNTEVVVTDRPITAQAKSVKRLEVEKTELLLFFQTFNNHLNSRPKGKSNKKPEKESSEA